MRVFASGVDIAAEISTTLAVSNFAFAGRMHTRMHFRDLLCFSYHKKHLYCFKLSYCRNQLVAELARRLHRHRI